MNELFSFENLSIAIIAMRFAMLVPLSLLLHRLLTREKPTEKKLVVMRHVIIAFVIAIMVMLVQSLTTRFLILTEMGTTMEKTWFQLFTTTTAFILLNYAFLEFRKIDFK